MLPAIDDLAGWTHCARSRGVGQPARALAASDDS